MDALARTQLHPLKDFDHIAEVRAAKREHLRGRNNVTSCRSPTRVFDTKLIKIQLKEKRQLEYLRRRSVSPEPCGVTSTRTKFSPKTFSVKHLARQMHKNSETIPANRHEEVILMPNSSGADCPSTGTWADSWSEQVTVMKQEKQESTSTAVMKELSQHSINTENCTKDEKSIKTSVHTESIQQKSSQQTKTIRTAQDAGVQTVSGLIIVKESDLQQLAEYLQEALWREEALKKKLSDLQENTSNLLNSSNTIWTARCSEDLLRNQIKALEAQLQICLQNLPKDGVKRVVMQMEKQKMIYEEKALVALQKITQEKMEALSKAEMLQVSVITAKAEALKWQSLFEELKLSLEQLRENQQHRNEQLQQLHGQVELSRTREDELRDEVVSLRQENKELQYNVGLLEQDNLALGEEIQSLRDGSNGSQDFVMQDHLTSEEVEAQLTPRRDSGQMEGQLHHTEEKLRLKERECEEMQTELQSLEQEFQSSQARLSQCRDELRQISHRRRGMTPCGSCWKVFLLLLLLLLLAVAGVFMLWMWHPPFREQVEDLYSDIETRIEGYLMEMASPQNSGCFRPV